ncbi:helix-turn-helix transcriptional regulator [Streptomyces sp. 11-1-2]|uniref:helix-turn-helix domain-containing protein n=1 Tax=unclassified Streptomyces TaxID=2593676 RepID=UPI001F090133|nr:helix-turn-helix transcriptional regulator [Streptomyces sp. 11-1-2]WTB04818.1 helix-turn-helix transcriptional regulator [Streptomyces antimycoticus]
MLKKIGLTPDANDLYRAMLKAPRADLQEIANTLDWAPDRASAALEELAELALVRPSRERFGNLRLVDPEVSLRILLQSQEMKLQKLQKNLSEGKLAVARLISDYREEEARQGPQGIKIVHGLDAIQACIERHSHDCTEEIEVFVPHGAQSENSLHAARPLDLMLLERSVQVRYIYLDSIRNDRPTTEYAEWIGENGGQVRTVPHLPMRMIIWDRRTAIIPADPNAADRDVFLLTSSGPVAALQSLFDLLWQQGSGFGKPRSRNTDGDLGDQESAILGLLAGGLTDEVIARKLGVSVRTSRRITAELMQRLGARSRFQLGALASQQGWLRP